MRRGHLSQYFRGIAAKRLSKVEVDPEHSNQHEFNGVQRLKTLLGRQRAEFKARFVYLSDDQEDFITADSLVSWYDAREYHPTRSEFRMYYSANAAIEAASPGDLLVVGRQPSDDLLIVIAKAASTSENQILWLFGLNAAQKGEFSTAEITDSRDIELRFGAKLVLQELGLEIEPETDFLESLLKRFPNGFPATKDFSEFARATLGNCSAWGPDAAIVAFMEREESLFRTLERHIVGDRIRVGFGDDVDAFIDYSLSIQNRRKSRAGFALENHFESILQARRIRYSRNATTEGRSRPDFLFPGVAKYRDLSYPAKGLRMLGVKSTCKERWRQVLAEAKRIKSKHLLTLEPGISESQTQEMQENQLRLVVPSTLQPSYSQKQRSWLLSVGDFLNIVQKLDA